MSKQQIDVIELACERDERELFSAVSFCLQPGDVLQVAGPNGAGKTSLLRIMGGFDARYRRRYQLCRKEYPVPVAGREYWPPPISF